MSIFSRLFSSKSAPFRSVVIAAAGSSSRMGGEDKLFATLGGIPVLARTLKLFQEMEEFQEILVVTREESLTAVGDLCREYGIDKVSKILVGSDTRLKSVLCGVRQVSQEAKIIAVHDGARPLTDPEIIRATLAAAEECSAAAPAIPLTDTVKEWSPDGKTRKTVDRDSLRAVQTPQIFDADLLKGALEAALRDKAALSDDCSAVERIGMPVFLTEGSGENIKITRPLDLIIGEAILAGRAAEDADRAGI